MKSSKFGRIKLDETALKEDMKKCLAFSNSDLNYSEFCIGKWSTFPIWTMTGEDCDGMVKSSDSGHAKPTKRGKILNYVSNIISEYFDISSLRLARLHTLEDGVLIPHKDFVELDNNQIRIHIPLQTNNYCLHSENSHVFNMRTGEVWSLYAAEPHSACNFSGMPRVNLCLDFDGNAEDPTSVIKIDKLIKCKEVNFVKRAPFTDEVYNAIMSITPLVNRSNYRDVLNFLSRIHFSYEIDNASVLDWLSSIYAKKCDELAYEHTLKYKHFLLTERAIGERNSYHLANSNV